MEILASVSRDCIWVPRPVRERDSRWLSNGRAVLHVLQGHYIQDANGTALWILLAQRLIHIYKEFDCRVVQLKAFVECMLMPKIIFGLWMEAEACQCFEDFNNWQSQPGELADKPGFRALELFFEITDHTFPRWHSCFLNPEKGFPNT